MTDPRTIKAIEYLQPALDESEESIIKEVNRLIAENQLTADLALQKWYQINALRELPKRAAKAVNRGRR